MGPASSMVQGLKLLTVRALGSSALGHCVCLLAWYRFYTCGFRSHVSRLAFHSLTISSFHTNVTYCQCKDMASFLENQYSCGQTILSRPLQKSEAPSRPCLGSTTAMILKHCTDLISAFKFMRNPWLPPDTRHSVSLW